MALKNQPYLPLYVQDFMTDEKLAECSAESTGVYIRLMCLLHKSDEYGCIVLKQKDKQTDNQIKNFCLKLSRHILYTNEVLERSISELVEEGVIQIDGDKLSQKRMVKDASVSGKRAQAGMIGGTRTQQKDKDSSAQDKANAQANEQANAQANAQANTEDESEYEIEDVNGVKTGTETTKPPEPEPTKPPKEPKRFVKPTLEQVEAYCKERVNQVDPEYFLDYYEARGWKLKDGPMKDWKASVRTWEKNKFEASAYSKPKEEPPSIPRRYKFWTQEEETDDDTEH